MGTNTHSRGQTTTVFSAPLKNAKDFKAGPGGLPPHKRPPAVALPSHPLRVGPLEAGAFEGFVASFRHPTGRSQNYVQASEGTLSRVRSGDCIPSEGETVLL